MKRPILTSVFPLNHLMLLWSGAELQGLSEHSLNIVVLYEYEKMQARVAFTWRDDFVLTQATNTLPAVINDSVPWLDASVSYNVIDQITVVWGG